MGARSRVRTNTRDRTDGLRSPERNRTRQTSRLYSSSDKANKQEGIGGSAGSIWQAGRGTGNYKAGRGNSSQRRSIQDRSTLAGDTSRIPGGEAQRYSCRLGGTGGC